MGNGQQPSVACTPLCLGSLGHFRCCFGLLSEAAEGLNTPLTQFSPKSKE